MKHAGALVNGRTGEPVLRDLRVADGFVSRFLGLQFRREIARGSGLLLVPCSSVHTMFMRFPVDIAFLDRGGAVLRVARGVGPWKPLVLSPRGTHATLEAAAGGMAIQRGDRLRLEPGAAGSLGTRLPKSVRFLLPRAAQ